MKKMDFKKISITDLAALVNVEFTKHGIKAILVGGACVAIYSNNRYVSYDLDFVTFETRSKVQRALEHLGFTFKGKYFERVDCPFFIEFVAPPVSVGDELVQKFHQLDTVLGKIELLTPTDCVKDRLSAFFHWNDRQSLQQAIMVCQNQKVSMKELKRWATKENQIEKFKEFSEGIA